MSCPRRGVIGAMELELELGLAPPNHAGSCGKRGAKEASGINKAGLPLFLRDDDGDHDSGDARNWEMSNERNRLVGWPPVKSAHRPRSRSNGGHVKVKMEGVAIGRKVDLSRHASYHQLHHTLRLMFPSSTSQNGDWMLVGDVPWESAKQLKILLV